MPAVTIADVLADRTIAAYSRDLKWRKHHDRVVCAEMQRDMRFALAGALRTLAKHSSPAAQFEMQSWAQQIDPNEADLAANLNAPLEFR